MKRICAVIASLLLLLPATGGSAPSAINDLKAENKNMIKSQKELNKRDRIEAQKGVQEFFSSINKKLRVSGKTRLSAPIDENKIETVKNQEVTHSKTPPKPKIFGYVNGEGVTLRTEPGVRFEAIGKLSFNEKVEVVAITKSTETINGYTDNWILIRRVDESEGWVFGQYVQKARAQAQSDGPIPPKKNGSIAAFEMPTDGIITSSFGYRVHPVSKKSGTFHRGIDIGAPLGTPVKVAADGTVRISEMQNTGYGNLIVVEHADGITTYYGHLSLRGVKVCQTVRRGDVIGQVGSTGMSTGPHLHFEVRRGNDALDPASYLR